MFSCVECMFKLWCNCHQPSKCGVSSACRAVVPSMARPAMVQEERNNKKKNSDVPHGS